MDQHLNVKKQTVKAIKDLEKSMGETYNLRETGLFKNDNKKNSKIYTTKD